MSEYPTILLSLILLAITSMAVGIPVGLVISCIWLTTKKWLDSRSTTKLTPTPAQKAITTLPKKTDPDFSIDWIPKYIAWVGLDSERDMVSPWQAIGASDDNDMAMVSTRNEFPAERFDVIVLPNGIPPE